MRGLTRSDLRTEARVISPLLNLTTALAVGDDGTMYISTLLYYYLALTADSVLFVSRQHTGRTSVPGCFRWLAGYFYMAAKGQPADPGIHTLKRPSI
jgi:hypothetical protein